MQLQPTSFEIGPDSGRLLVRTHREGLGARAGHDLVIEATDWRGRVRIDSADPPRGHLEVRVDGRGLEVREGRGGAKPLTDKDRREIKDIIRTKVLDTDRHSELVFIADQAAVEGQHARLSGELMIAGQSRPLSVDVDVEQAADGPHARGAAKVRQTDFGIKPYRALMGALRVADEVVVDFDVRLPAGIASP
jgi:polyisoprenoid-binding protein YceI